MSPTTATATSDYNNNHVRTLHRNSKDRNSFELKQSAIHSLQSDGTLEQISALERLQVEKEYNERQNVWARLAIRSSHKDVTQKELIQRSTFLVISSLTVAAGMVWGLMYVVLGEWMAALMPFIYSTSMSLVLLTVICQAGGGGNGDDDCDDVDTYNGHGARSGGMWKLIQRMIVLLQRLLRYLNKNRGNDHDGRSRRRKRSSVTMKMMEKLCIDLYDIYAECQLGLIMACPFAVHVALGGIKNSGGVMLWSFLSPMGAAFFRSAKESLIWFWIYLGVSGVLLGWEVGFANSNSEITQQVYFLMNIMGCMGVIFSAVFLFARELEKEYAKSEEVLSSILPSKIVKRIKRGEFPIVDHASDVTILFADLVGFTKASAELHPNFLVGLFLRDIFLAFDESVYKHGLEKIKTIGDAYMVVGGLDYSGGEDVAKKRRRRSSVSEEGAYDNYDDDDDDDEEEKIFHHPTSTMMLALDMFNELARINRKYNLEFSLRIGVHKGPVVAGVLGLKRFTYDVWGDSVNVSLLFVCFFSLCFVQYTSIHLSHDKTTFPVRLLRPFPHIFHQTASRMESNGVPNLIHLSSDIYEVVDHLTNDFEFTCCGKIDVKGKGEMTTYLAKPLR